MQRNGSNRHLTKHNYDLKSTCCPPKNASPGTSLKNPNLDIDKKLTQTESTVIYSNKDIV